MGREKTFQQFKMAQAQMTTSVPKSPNGEFNRGLFSCTEDCGTCVLACCCSCVVYGQNQQAAFNKEGCFGDALVYCLLAGCYCTPCYAASGRGNIRGIRGIIGGFFGDCCAHLCCSPCALTQEKHEADIISGKASA